MSSQKKPLTSLERIMLSKGISRDDKPNRNLNSQNSNTTFTGSPIRSYRNATITSNTNSKQKLLDRRATLKLREQEGHAAQGHEIFARSALIQPSFFPKESRPLTKSPIYQHSPFLNKLLLFDHQAAGKKGKKKNIGQKLGFAMERKYYNTDLSMFAEAS